MAEHRHLFVTRIRQGQAEEWPGWGSPPGSPVISLADGVVASHAPGGAHTRFPQNWRVAVVNGMFLAQGDPADARFGFVLRLVGELAGDATGTWVHFGEALLASRQGFLQTLKEACSDEAADHLKDALPYNLGLNGQSSILMGVQAEVTRLQGLVGLASRTGSRVDERALSEAIARLDQLWTRLQADWRMKALHPLFALYIDVAGLLEVSSEDPGRFGQYMGEVRTAHSKAILGWVEETRAELGDELWRRLQVEDTLKMLNGTFDETKARNFAANYKALLTNLDNQKRGACSQSPD